MILDSSIMGLIIIIRPMMLDSKSKHVSNSGIWISLHGGYVDTGSRAADYLKEKVKKHTVFTRISAALV